MQTLNFALILIKYQSHGTLPHFMIIPLKTAVWSKHNKQLKAYTCIRYNVFVTVISPMNQWYANW
jgi:hypothetical protein